MLPSSATTRRSTEPVRALAVRQGKRLTHPDRLASEEPMEIRVAGPGREPEGVAVIMRTPGHDFELAAGFLWTEGLIAFPQDIVAIDYCDLPPDEQHYNVVTVRLSRAPDLDPVRRTFAATSSCGICGKASLDQVRVKCRPVGAGPTVSSSVVMRLPATLRERQRLFEQTGGLHAAGLFDPSGALLDIREDVGRHNAVDKLVGRAVLSRHVPLSDRLLLVSGRVSFEIVQKAAVAGLPIVCAVSAPSSLAVSAAEDLGLTVVGFLRPQGFNVYSHPERVGA
jgi:FdhD protein